MNRHTYTDFNGEKHTQTLPPGRFLNKNETLQKSDLYLSSYEKTYKTGYVGLLAEFNHTYYRPSKTKYRPLKQNEKILLGDQWYNQNTRGWRNVKFYTTGDHVSFYYTLSFRRKVK